MKMYGSEPQAGRRPQAAVQGPRQGRGRPAATVETALAAGCPVLRARSPPRPCGASGTAPPPGYWQRQRGRRRAAESRGKPPCAEAAASRRPSLYILTDGRRRCRATRPTRRTFRRPSRTPRCPGRGGACSRPSRPPQGRRSRGCGPAGCRLGSRPLGRTRRLPFRARHVAGAAGRAERGAQRGRGGRRRIGGGGGGVGGGA